MKLNKDVKLISVKHTVQIMNFVLNAKIIIDSLKLEIFV